MKQCFITHSLSTRDWIDKSAYSDRLTHLLSFHSLLKMKIESCHSLPVDYGTTLLIKKEILLTNWCHETNIRSMLVQCHLPTGTDISTSSDPATKNMVTTDLCFTQLMIGHLRLDYSCLHVKALKYYLPQEAPDELFASVYHSI